MKQHAEAIDSQQATGPRRGQERRQDRHVDDIGNHAIRIERIEVDALVRSYDVLRAFLEDARTEEE